MGRVARSSELNLAGHLLATALILYGMGAGLVRALTELLKLHLETAADRPLNHHAAFVQFLDIGQWSLTNVLPIMAALLIGGILVNVAQVGFLFSTERMGIDFTHVNPVSGLQRLFSLRAIVTLAMSTAKFAVLFGVAWWFISGHMTVLLGMIEKPLLTAFGEVGILITKLAMYLATALVLIGAADYGYQWWKHERDIMMTKDQVKREIKEMDGDPMIVQRRREAHRKMIAAKSIRATSFATALLTNPTHVSIAFKYEPPQFPLPTIIAKGLDDVALKMREIAAENNIPIIERPELARRLYREVEVGQPIPEDLYGVFLEILKYVYSITGKVPELKI